MAKKRKPLAERVEWTDDPLGKFHIGRLGEFKVVLMMTANQRPHFVFVEWNGCRVFESNMDERTKRPDAAKTKAVDMAREFVLAAAADWTD